MKMQKIDSIVTYKSGYKHQNDKLRVYQTEIRPDEVLESRYITLNTDGRLFINGAYAWDGPTGVPEWLVKRWMKWLMRPSLIHDALCQLAREGLLSPKYAEQIDIEFKLACHQDARWKWLGNTAYYFVRKFGSFAIDPANKRPILTAP